MIAKARMVLDKDVAVPMRDGASLRANVYVLRTSQTWLDLKGSSRAFPEP